MDKKLIDDFRKVLNNFEDSLKTLAFDWIADCRGDVKISIKTDGGLLYNIKRLNTSAEGKTLLEAVVRLVILEKKKIKEVQVYR